MNLIHYSNKLEGIILTHTENHNLNTELPDILTKHDKKVINNFIRDFGQLIILWILNKKRLYGNAIINKINNFYPDKDKKITGSSKIYPALHNLEDNGLIEGSWETRGRQRIKYYEITDKGRDEILRVKKIIKYVFNYELKDFIHEMILADQ
jgi:DNA-binding PadR family transcriptional regulator